MTTPSTEAKPNLRAVLAVLLAIPLLIMLAKWPGLPTAGFLRQYATLDPLPGQLQDKLAHILFIPLGAMLVVLVRLTLGLRVLGPFRSVLLAAAFQTTGIVLGLAFLSATIAIVASIQPAIRTWRLPYFGRITVLLSAVAVFMVLGVLLGSWLHVSALNSIAYFPIVVLCLIGDAFARTAQAEGLRSAVKRGAVTGAVAVALTALAKTPHVSDFLIRYPEVMIAQMGGIVFIARYMNWRVLDRFNPKPVSEAEEEDEGDAEQQGSRVAQLVSTVSPSHTLYLTEPVEPTVSQLS